MTGIEWTDTTWNPAVGCSHVSEGCRHCYAETMDRRIRAIAGEEFRPWTAANAAYNVRLHPERLTAPLRWRKPRRVFVNSMSDLFHEQVPDQFILEVWLTMAMAKEHTFQVMTKRPERMRELLRGWQSLPGGNRLFADDLWPLPNVWLGVSVENQAAAAARIPVLLATPAAVRFLSCEPLLGPVDLNGPGRPYLGEWTHQGECPPWHGQRVDWVIVGGESGPGARPCHVNWIRDIVRQCQAASVPVFVQQLGAQALESLYANGQHTRRLSYDRKGSDPMFWPEDLRVREFPR